MRGHLVSRGMAAGATLGAVVGGIASRIFGDVGFWLPTAIALGVAVGLAFEVGRGPNP